tara:strand:+ start:457 stop:663 length:207 start_codon:yes stop_codon:yes gene_type:complete
MRISKIKGYKDCKVCGKNFGYFHPRAEYCSDDCHQSEIYKMSDKYRNRAVTLAYVPDRLMDKGADSGR